MFFAAFIPKETETMPGRDGVYRMHYCVSRIINKLDAKIFSTSNSKSKDWLAKQLASELGMAAESFDPRKFGFSDMGVLIQKMEALNLLRLDGAKVFVADGAAQVETNGTLPGLHEGRSLPRTRHKCMVFPFYCSQRRP